MAEAGVVDMLETVEIITTKLCAVSDELGLPKATSGLEYTKGAFRLLRSRL